MARRERVGQTKDGIGGGPTVAEAPTAPETQMDSTIADRSVGYRGRGA